MALPEGISDAFPLTPAQKGMLFHVLEVPSARGRYVAVLNCLLKGPLDARRLQNALQASVNSRDAYRAGFVWEGIKNPVQLIHRSVNVPWTDLDWTEETDVEQRLDRLVQMECLRHFDLKRAPLMHVTLVRLSDQSHRLVWTIHHLISDAWSTGVVLESILNTYATGSSDAAVAAQFRDHLTWLQNSNNQTDTEFWTGHFSGLEGASEVDVTATGEVTYSRQNHISQRLKNEVVERVGEIARELRVTQNTVLSGVWGLVLRRLSGKNDIVFGQTFSGRSAPVRGVDRAAGAFINTLPSGDRSR